MIHLPVTHNARRSTKSVLRGSDDAKSTADRLRAAMAGPNLFVVLAFCAIGLLVTLNLIFRFPDFGISVEQLAQSPG
jgi:hypothetical protein